MKRLFKNTAGFSLVELMVVVAIVGILASVAIPNFQNFQAKARQGEVKSHLSSVFTAEVNYNSEWGIYFEDFQNLGLCPTGDLKYRFGFSSTSTNVANYTGGGVAASTPAVSISSDLVCPAVCACQEAPYGGYAFAAPAGTAAMATFSAEANGNIDNDAGSDIWTINQNKQLANATPDI